MGINGAECMQVAMAQDHAGKIHKEVPRGENQVKLDSTHAAFLLALVNQARDGAFVQVWNLGHANQT